MFRKQVLIGTDPNRAFGEPNNRRFSISTGLASVSG
jgi:hypothetical protein